MEREGAEWGDIERGETDDQFETDAGEHLTREEYEAREAAEDAAAEEDMRCKGHPAGPFDPMGQTVFCDGSCS